jgi:type II secretion system protein H
MRTNGFTLIEMAIVITIVGLASAIAYPRVSAAVTRERVRSAAVAVVATHAKARAVAIQRGRPVVLELTGGRLIMRSAHPVTGAPDTVAVENVAARYGVAIKASRDSVRFDPRGLSMDMASTAVHVALGADADTVRISGMGRVLR